MFDICCSIVILFDRNMNLFKLFAFWFEVLIKTECIMQNAMIIIIFLSYFLLKSRTSVVWYSHQNIIMAMKMLWKLNFQKCWRWLAFFFKSAGSERVNMKKRTSAHLSIFSLQFSFSPSESRFTPESFSILLLRSSSFRLMESELRTEAKAEQLSSVSAQLLSLKINSLSMYSHSKICCSGSAAVMFNK